MREFGQETDSGEFMCHRDREDRVIESIDETDWLIQIDNIGAQQLKQRHMKFYITLI